ncbi:MAG: carbohydrate-binding domain-containing protein [Clostridia bacterium]|nr:carbohydrate-binding domain-containing protein [Clostridia bacterium]
MKHVISTGLALILMLSVLCSAAAQGLPDVASLYKDRDLNDQWDADEVETIRLSESGAEVSDPQAVSVENQTVTIREEGDYLVTGTWKGQIVVAVGEEQKVRLILQNVSIDSPAGPAIFEQSADKLVLTLDGESVNTLSDHTQQIFGSETAAAAVYAQDDLSINGTGTLVIEGGAKNGIHCKADLVIADGHLQVTSVNDAVKGRNSVLILGGSISVVSGGDAISSNRDNKEDKGWVIVEDGTLNIKTGDGAMNGKQKSAASRKGLKAVTDLTILGGEIVLDTEDDGLHAGNVIITDGRIDISTGDEAIQADDSVSISGGEIVIRLCDEEIKGENVEVADGTVRSED